MENVVIFYDHFEYFTAIWYTLWQVGTYSMRSFRTFFHFGLFGPSKIWQSWYIVKGLFTRNMNFMSPDVARQQWNCF
jgi:hypothetical protein